MTDTPGGIPAAAPANQGPWFGSIDPTALGFQAGDPGKAELTGYLTNRGYDKLEPAAAFAAAVKAHRAAEAHLGAPADQLLRMPKDTADAEGWARVDAKFGVPAEAKDYDFSAVKINDQPLDPALADALRPVLKSSHVGKDAATEIAKSVADFYAKKDASSATAAAQNLALERDVLKTNWGSNVEANMIIAKGAAKALGVDEATVAALEKVVGYAKVMEMFRNIGSKIGEDQFITNQAPGGSGVMSGDQAAATLAAKRADNAWTNKLLSGDAATMQEFDHLTRLINASRKAA